VSVQLPKLELTRLSSRGLGWRFELADQDWKVGGRDVPDCLEFDTLIPMHYAVSHRNDLGPRDLGTRLSELWRESIRRLADNCDAVENRQA
jgi:hypothetical protein